jgi:type I restriction enzyme S subunit
VKTVEFGTLFHFIRNGMNVRQDKSGEGLPISRIETISDATVDGTRVGFAGLSEGDCEGWLLETGDILFSHINSVEHIGKCAVYRGTPEKLVHGMNLLCLRSDTNKLLPEFAKYLMRATEFRTRFANFINKAVNQASVSIGNLKTIPVTVPPLAEQRRIAEVLDRAEALRANRRAALAQLDELTQAIFLDLFGDPKSNPKAWPQKAMAELFATSPIFGSMIPPVPEKCGWLSLRVGNIQDWTLDLSDSKYVDLPTASVERHSVKDGDLLLARAIASQDHLGKCVIAHPNDEQWAFDSHLMRLRFDLKRTEPEFIRHLLMTSGGRSLFLKASRKSTVQFNINTKEISALQIPIPPIELQGEFARRVTAVETLKTAHRASLAELDTLFASLQHRAFRGEL